MINHDDVAPAVLAPVNKADFMSTYWEQQPLHISRDDDSYFEHLLTLSDVTTALQSTIHSFPDVQLTRAGDTPDPASYTDEQNRILPLRLLEHYANGASVVVSGAHQKFVGLSNLCREFQKFFGFRAQANIYLSPAGKQGFNAHYDTHDVFILQVSGRKTFNFYESAISLPFPHDQFNRDALKQSDITQQIELAAGDTLYIPRGVVHDAVADADTPSLHITLGVFAIVMRDLLQALVQRVAEADVQLRHSVHSETAEKRELTLQSSSGNDSLISSVRQSLERLDNEALIYDVLSQLHDEQAIAADQRWPTDLEHKFGMADANIELTAQSVLSVCHAAIIDVEQVNGLAKLRSFGQVLDFNEEAAAAVAWMLQQDRFRVEQLPLSAIDAKLALCKRLLQENCVQVESVA